MKILCEFFVCPSLKQGQKGYEKLFTPLYILCSRALNMYPKALDSSLRALNISSKPLNIKSSEEKNIFEKGWM